MEKKEESIKISIGLLMKLIICAFDNADLRIYSSITDTADIFFWADEDKEFACYDIKTCVFQATSPKFIAVVKKAKEILHEKEKEKSSSVPSHASGPDDDICYE